MRIFPGGYEKTKDDYNKKKETARFMSRNTGPSHEHFWKRIVGRENTKKCTGCGVESKERPRKATEGGHH